MLAKNDVFNMIDARSINIFGADGKATSFGTLLDQQNMKVNRTLVVFIRHFFCGNCQEYIRRLTTDLAPSKLPKDLSIIIIGCGAPTLIHSYLEITKSPFPLYADPSIQLYRSLGMQKSLSLGSRGPEYIHHSIATGVVKSIVQGLKRIPSGDVGKGGDMSVNGGEFLFTRDHANPNWSLNWSHCMMNTRDHLEIEVLKTRLGMDSEPSLSGLSAQINHNNATIAPKSNCVNNVGNQNCSTLRKSTSTKRRSWMLKAGHMTRSSSMRRSTVPVS